LNKFAVNRTPMSNVAALHMFSARNVAVDRNNNYNRPQSFAQLPRSVIQICNVAVTVKKYVDCYISFMTIIQSPSTSSAVNVGHTAAAQVAFCNMAGCGEYIKAEFPLIDDDLYLYVEGTNCYCELQKKKKGQYIYFIHF